jgi:hypothetical protein
MAAHSKEATPSFNGHMDKVNWITFLTQYIELNYIFNVTQY